MQKLQKEYTEDEEQRKLLLLLAVNAELGLFLLRRGQKNSSRRLYVLYRSSKADGTNCKSVEIWEKQMESETGEGK